MEKDKREEEWEDPLECPENLEYDCEKDELDCLRQHWRQIRTRIVRQRHLDVHHIRITEMNIQDIMNGIFRVQKTASTTYRQRRRKRRFSSVTPKAKSLCRRPSK